MVERDSGGFAGGPRPGAGRLARRLALAVLLLACAGGACRKAAAPRHWTWQPGDLAQVLATAHAQGTAVLVEVYAQWCPTCHQLERDIFETAAERLPADGLLGWRVDFDTPAGQEVAVQYRVMGLPTTLVLDAAGKELGRVEGFDDTDSWLAGLHGALAGHDDSAAALARFAAAPADVKLMAQAGAARLARGEEAEGLRLLEQARIADPADAQQAWSDATRTLGRWFFRVRHQYDKALGYFREGAARKGDTDAGWGFQYWTAMSLRALGRPADALALLDGLITAYAGRAEPVSLKADYLYMIGGDDDAALALARQAVQLDPTDDDNQYLLAVLAERTGDRAAALAAVRRAIELAPGKAIYEHLLQRLSGPPAS